jgi:hypothetical protein
LEIRAGERGGGCERGRRRQADERDATSGESGAEGEKSIVGRSEKQRKRIAVGSRILESKRDERGEEAVSAEPRSAVSAEKYRRLR